MAISLKIGSVSVIMSKFFSDSDVVSVLEKITELGATQVLFLDTAPTVQLSNLITQLQKKDILVTLRDHHGIKGNPKNEREEQIRSAANDLQKILGNSATISNRTENPACSTLVELGEFTEIEGLVVIADPDPDGLTASMKALGISYPELDSDAAILDGARSEQTSKNLSSLALLLVKGLATLPPFNPKIPATAENAKGELFSSFVSAVQGDEESLTSLEAKVEKYERSVDVAEELVSSATQLVKGPYLIVDTVGSPQFDLTTLTRGLESTGCKITIIRKDNGPIAANHGGVQYSLAVVKKFQENYNLQDLLPKVFESSPKSGIISNTSFLLHVSEEIWEDEVRPRLWVEE